MRNVDKKAAEAFVYGYAFSNNNTKVVSKQNGDIALLYIFGNKIAERIGSDLFIDSCEWTSNTTRNRLNAVLDVMCKKKSLRIKNREYVWENGEVWDGERVKI
jgi:hypothetical protein